MQVAQHLLFDFVSGADERFIAQTPEGTVLFDISDTANESVTKDFVGSGSITLESGVGITTYRRILDIKGVGSASFSGSGVIRSSFDPPEGTYLHIFGDGYSDFKVSFATQSQKSNVTSGWRTYSPRYRLHTSLWYRSEHWYRDRHVPLAWWYQRRRNRVHSIVTTRFLPKYPATGRITIDGKAIGRTNAPILTDGTIYILGIGTEGNGQIGDDGIGDLNGVEFGAKERFVRAYRVWCWISPIRLPDNWGRKQDQSRSLVTMETTKILAHLDKSPYVRKVVFSQSRELSYQKSDLVHSLTVSAWSRRSQHLSEIGSGSLFAIGGIAESTTARRTCPSGTSIFNGTARRILLCFQTPRRYCNNYTIWNRSCSKKIQLLLVLELLHSATIKKSLLVSYFSPTGSGTFSILGGAAEATVEPSLLQKSNSYRYHRCCKKQDTSKYSKTLFLLELSHYLENSLTQISITSSTYTARSGNITISGATTVKFYQELFPYSDYSLSMELLLRKILYLPKKYNSLQHRRRFLQERDCSLPRLHSFLAFLFQYKARCDQRNCELWILWGRQRSWNFRNYYTFQHSSCSSIVDLHSTYWQGHIGTLPSRCVTLVGIRRVFPHIPLLDLYSNTTLRTRHTQDRHMLESVKLTSLVLVSLKFLDSRKVEPTLSLFNV